jgi:hypothetical protein
MSELTVDTFRRSPFGALVGDLCHQVNVVLHGNDTAACIMALALVLVSELDDTPDELKPDTVRGAVVCLKHIAAEMMRQHVSRTTVTRSTTV